MATPEVSGLPPGGEAEVVERDIDGLPLRDHKKVDLKAILGHSPEVDDDDDDDDEVAEVVVCDRQAALQLEAPVPDLEDGEREDPEEEEEEEDDEGEDGLNCVVQRQRRSSLRTVQHHQPPDSPTGERKAVRFADSLGLGLEAIRDLADAEEPPEIPHSAMTALRLRRKRDPNARLVLTPTYSHPPVDAAAFLCRLERQRVLLESSFVSSRDLTVSGVVRVTKVSDEKTVTVRYSTDAWATNRDVPAQYVPNSDDGTTDQFVFIIHLPEGFGDEVSSSDRQGRLQFAVAFHAGDDTFWDNNDGGNYVIDCVMRSRESSISGEPNECQPLSGVGP